MKIEELKKSVQLKGEHLTRRRVLLLIDVALAAKRLKPQCTNPASFSDGAGEWSVPVWRDCGECTDCTLLNALDAVEAG